MSTDEIFEFLKVIGGWFSLGTIFYILGITYYLPRNWFYLRFAAWFNDTWHKSAVLTFAYGLRLEIIPIIGVSLFLNIVGWGLTSNGGRPMLFLDMIGTALCAILIGPWFGSLVAIITPFLISIVFPGADAERIAYWLLVQLTGGVCWGMMAQTNQFRNYFHRSEIDVVKRVKSDLPFLLLFGVLAASIMAMAGTIVSGEKNLVISANTSFGFYVLDLFKSFQASLADGHLSDLPWVAKKILTDLYRWAVYTILYIPDKTISAGIGLLGAKYIFPLYAERLTDLEENKPNGFSWLIPVVAIGVYVSVPGPFYSCSSFWVRYLPIFILSMAAVHEFFYKSASIEFADNRIARLKTYKEDLAKVSGDNFFSAIVVAVLLAGIVFMSGLYIFDPADGMTFRRSFFRIIFICLSAFYVLRLSTKQWSALFFKKRALESRRDTRANNENPPDNTPANKSKAPRKAKVKPATKSVPKKPHSLWGSKYKHGEK